MQSDMPVEYDIDSYLRRNEVPGAVRDVLQMLSDREDIFVAGITSKTNSQWEDFKIVNISPIETTFDINVLNALGDGIAPEKRKNFTAATYTEEEGMTFGIIIFDEVRKDAWSKSVVEQVNGTVSSRLIVRIFPSPDLAKLAAERDTFGTVRKENIVPNADMRGGFVAMTGEQIERYLRLNGNGNGNGNKGLLQMIGGIFGNGGQ